MSANGTKDDSPKKRKICIDNEYQEGQINEKILKLEGTCNGSETSQSPYTAQTGSSTASSSQASSSNTQASKCGTCNGSEASQSPYTAQTGSSTASTSQASSSNTQTSSGGSSGQNGEVSGSSQSSVPLPAVQNSPQKTEKTLELQQGSVFDDMMKSFSSNEPPTNITFNGEAYNLTRAFEEFWSEFYEIPGYTIGHITKIPNDENLKDIQLSVIAKILRRGWEDEHYFPKRIAQPFLEACLFKRDNNGFVMMSKKIVLDFLEPGHEIIQIIQDDTKPKVDQEIVDVCKKLNPDSEARYLYIGAEKDTACIYVVRDYMLKTKSSSRARHLWTDELIGLLDLEMFRFLMSPDITLTNDLGEDMTDSETLETYLPPHKLWRTFFYGFNQDIIDYYNQMLGEISSDCYYCKEVVITKEFLSCPKVLSSFRSDRHDCILRKIYREVNSAIEKKRGFFASGNDWKCMIMHGNKWDGWPSDLKTSNGNDLPSDKHPHIVAYSLFPKKVVHMIEFSVSWEHWLTKQINGKIEEFANLKTILERNGYKVGMHAVVVGSRGVVTQDVYKFFCHFLGMRHSDISRLMEKISKTVLAMPYNDFMYNTAENGMYQI